MTPDRVDASDLLTTEQVNTLWRDAVTELCEGFGWQNSDVRNAIHARMDKLQADIDTAEDEADCEWNHEFEVRMKYA